MLTLLRVYQECAVSTARSVARHPWTLLLPVGYGLVLSIASRLLVGLGPLNGFVLALVTTALASSFLFFVDETVGQGNFSPGELKRSLAAYFWPVMNLSFVLWIGRMVLGGLFSTLPNGGALMLVLSMALFILLNAAPEIIYQRQIHGGLATITESVKFIQSRWIEWFIPNLAFGALLFFGLPFIERVIGARFVGEFVLPMLLFPIMVFRGHLFRLLTSYSSRQLKLRYSDG